MRNKPEDNIQDDHYTNSYGQRIPKGFRRINGEDVSVDIHGKPYRDGGEPAWRHERLPISWPPATESERRIILDSCRSNMKWPKPEKAGNVTESAGIIIAPVGLLEPDHAKAAAGDKDDEVPFDIPPEGPEDDSFLGQNFCRVCGAEGHDGECYSEEETT